jgi:hypothetical protein
VGQLLVLVAVAQVGVGIQVDHVQIGKDARGGPTAPSVTKCSPPSSGQLAGSQDGPAALLDQVGAGRGCRRASRDRRCRRRQKSARSRSW